MNQSWKDSIGAETVRYILAGIATTGVNLFVFFILEELVGLNLNTSNFIAIFMAILFAYIVNKQYVFRSETQTPQQWIQECVNFFGARIVTMFIEMVGVVLFIEGLHFSEMPSKIAIQFVILVLNYIFSKLFVFKYAKQQCPSK